MDTGAPIVVIDVALGDASARRYLSDESSAALGVRSGGRSEPNHICEAKGAWHISCLQMAQNISALIFNVTRGCSDRICVRFIRCRCYERHRCPVSHGSFFCCTVGLSYYLEDSQRLAHRTRRPRQSHEVAMPLRIACDHACNCMLLCSRLLSVLTLLSGM